MTKYRNWIPMLCAATLCAGFASGCTDLKPIQAQLDDLKAQVDRLNSETARVKSQADAAASVGHSAAAAGQHAQSTAETASTAASQNRRSIEAINEKIDRMFRHKLSK
jgi:outer membrane murein-binding lipoprotein Lpp